MNNFPIFRHGSTATQPGVDYNGEPKFLIDMACFPGSNGSPVLLYNPGGYATREGFTFKSRLYLIGVLYAGPMFTAEGVAVCRRDTRCAKRAVVNAHSNEFRGGNSGDQVAGLRENPIKRD
ncbi:hypothetical protein [Alicyclobacillus sp. ALC3]|uniref:hypothetical protein n=1 Tax=Alicyclobacillus sp. ALC3 TaxID=2796143 RepID=UPI002379C9C3|nr:hypothetical protein [Alicyclobacillus sp. ALC3]WDL97888.1 hypothetical protein JC200_04000 [Alicyclobacillus sp. ALC3]